ncbi:DUF5819 family protein [Streptomyces sp. NBC_01317]|uniref:DUF5819 family protein n=1 Tax=Streptomyces sp. NBC_01317 TaxID=2903822 RepID=UPI002E12B57E|nr:DUF5819 family protein [Streptomyces sp. NBC_01317]
MSSCDEKEILREQEEETIAESVPSARPRPWLARTLKAGLRTVVALCAVTTLTHVTMVFLHVAPANAVSQRYGRQIDAWIYPLFEQNWRLFAPDPDSVNRRILARTAHTAPDGTVEVSDWFDVTAADRADVKHNVFPSHTTQNLLRRAWTSYVELHGGDDRPHSERAAMIQRYLYNIASDRAADHGDGPFESLQLRVLTLAIAPPAPPDGRQAPTASRVTENRLLPWRKVNRDGN